MENIYIEQVVECKVFIFTLIGFSASSFNTTSPLIFAVSPDFITFGERSKCFILRTSCFVPFSLSYRHELLFNNKINNIKKKNWIKLNFTAWFPSHSRCGFFSLARFSGLVYQIVQVEFTRDEVNARNVYETYQACIFEIHFIK